MPILRSGGIPAGYPFGKWPRGIHLLYVPGRERGGGGFRGGDDRDQWNEQFCPDGINANAALLVGIGSKDFGGDHPLSGMYLQRKLEQAAFQLAGGSYLAPAQRVEDFLQNISSTADGRCDAYLWARDRSQQFIGLFARLCGGIHAPGNFGHGSEAAWICLSRCGFDWVETRSSAPVRLLREKISSLFPWLVCIPVEKEPDMPEGLCLRL